MTYRILADAVLVLHLAFIAFVMLGGLAMLRRPRLAWLHLPAVLWAAGLTFAGGICPLTPLIYPDGLTREVQIVLGCLVIAVNLAVYLWRGRSPSPKGDRHL